MRAVLCFETGSKDSVLFSRKFSKEKEIEKRKLRSSFDRNGF